jgi:hypothetical protein
MLAIRITTGHVANGPPLVMHHKVVLPCGAWERPTPDGASFFEACSTSVFLP